jgi:hypothetical protein
MARCFQISGAPTLHHQTTNTAFSSWDRNMYSGNPGCRLISHFIGTYRIFVVVCLSPRHLRIFCVTRSSHFCSRRPSIPLETPFMSSGPPTCPSVSLPVHQTLSVLVLQQMSHNHTAMNMYRYCNKFPVLFLSPISNLQFHATFPNAGAKGWRMSSPISENDLFILMSAIT